ncbi:MAG: DNA polymerase I [Patescibacteria group bacterium]|nr:DNA polymerase I [Patescibacteria group bacterium]
MPKTKDKLMIIDGNALVHRSFHALPPSMTLKDGTVVNAVYGFTSFLIKSIRDLKPKYVVLTMDMKGPTFRHKQFKEYKAKRVKAPDELYAQIPLVKKIAKSFNIPVFEKKGFEADDLIGTLVHKVESKKLKIESVVVTGDKDTLQLVNKNTKVYSMSRGLTDSIIYDEDLVMTKMGIRPDQVIDYKALRGDPSDNIPGVKGIGDKTALELLHKYETLDKIYEQIKKNEEKLEKLVKPRIIGLLKEYKEQAYLSRELATIKCDVDIKFDLEATTFNHLDKDKVLITLSDFEFRSLLPRVQQLFSETSGESKEEKEEAVEDKFERNRKQFKYILVDDEKKFNKFFRELSEQKSFTFDTETSGFDPITANLLGVSFSWKKGCAHYVQLKIKNEKLKIDNNLFNYSLKNEKRKASSKLNPWLKKLKGVFEDEKIEKHAHNAKFDVRVMKNKGIEIKNVSFDSMIASYLLNSGSRQHNLDMVVFSELNFEKISKTDLLGRGRDKISFSEVEDERLMLYSCEDADYTEQLVKSFKKKLKKEKLDKLFIELEMPLVPVLARMEENGVKLDSKFLDIMRSKVNRKINALIREIHDLAGEEFNISSTKQLQAVLFDKMEIPSDKVKKTKTGISTAASELEKMVNLHPIIKLIQEYREYIKLSNTYIDTLPKLINARTGRVHTSYNQTITATGRLSSNNPNLQNIPVRTELGREIRKAFVSEKGYSLVALDYSQIELRLAAHYSGDKKMVEAFKDNMDIHTATAAEINQVSIDKVEPEMRREAKAINFGILYGQGPHGLSQTADIPYVRAQEFISAYFEKFKSIKKFIDDTIEQVKVDGHVCTLMGRVRHFPEINSSVAMVRKAAERMAVNMPLQGTAADMLKKAMIEVDEEITSKGCDISDDVKMLMTVHDELIFEIKNSLVEKTVPKIKKIMEEVIKLKVPVVVEAKQGKNWGEMELIKN